MSTAEAFDGIQDVPMFQDPFLLDQPSESHGSSTTDELDVHSSSSQVDPISSFSHEIDLRCLAPTKSDTRRIVSRQVDYIGRRSMSETDLPRLEGMTLISPTKNTSASRPSCPNPSKTTGRKASRFVEAVGATLRKATTRRKTKKHLPQNRPESPTFETPFTATRQRPRQSSRGNSNARVPSNFSQSAPGNFIHGSCDDPFTDVPPLPPPSISRYYQNESMSPPMISPVIKSEPGSYQLDHSDGQVPLEGSWQQNHQPITIPLPNDQWSDMQIMENSDPGWFDYNMMAQSGKFIDQKNANLNLVMHSQQAQLPYEFVPFPDTSASGLMIHVPKPWSPQPAIVNDLNMKSHAHLPPLPPTAVERRARPPRAISSGARHFSVSPVRKTRAPSASPTCTPSGQQSRHNSGGSFSSLRSVSGRLPASMPGTPCSVRKRRSREPSGSSEVGFVNFTPDDGSMLMTGVAPSGSSKTKARREKEALERRRKLSEAAIKAVAAAGGDVERLMKQGFAF